MRRTTALDLTVVTGALWALTVAPASAYIDGGSTMLVFQWLVAGLAAAWFGVKLFWGRLVALFRRDDDADRDLAEDEDDQSVADARQT